MKFTRLFIGLLVCVSVFQSVHAMFSPFGMGIPDDFDFSNLSKRVPVKLLEQGSSKGINKKAIQSLNIALVKNRNGRSNSVPTPHSEQAQKSILVVDTDFQKEFFEITKKEIVKLKNLLKEKEDLLKEQEQTINEQSGTIVRGCDYLRNQVVLANNDKQSLQQQFDQQKLVINDLNKEIKSGEQAVYEVADRLNKDKQDLQQQLNQQELDIKKQEDLARQKLERECRQLWNMINALEIEKANLENLSKLQAEVIKERQNVQLDLQQKLEEDQKFADEFNAGFVKMNQLADQQQVLALIELQTLSTQAKNLGTIYAPHSVETACANLKGLIERWSSLTGVDVAAISVRQLNACVTYMRIELDKVKLDAVKQMEQVRRVRANSWLGGRARNWCANESDLQHFNRQIIGVENELERRFSRGQSNNQFVSPSIATRVYEKFTLRNAVKVAAPVLLAAVGYGAYRWYLKNKPVAMLKVPYVDVAPALATAPQVLPSPVVRHTYKTFYEWLDCERE
ncbi:TPA: hypothetical protein DDZ86_00830 [Candidatus Dependentiae bacterium]|nr:MAG: hypothetical protein UW09_C0004G0048 [candidate division TM6 bacterium GW2011_GWF2_43_87]HBL98169.1 hypothetical protein [Candidatus Dependentiae bacterium]